MNSFMGDMGWIGFPLSIIALAFLVHGFPDIRIGTRDTFNHYYQDGPEDTFKGLEDYD